MKMSNRAKASRQTVKPRCATAARAPNLRCAAEDEAAVAAGVAKLPVVLHRRLLKALLWTRKLPHLLRSQTKLPPTELRKCKKLRKCKRRPTPRPRLNRGRPNDDRLSRDRSIIGCLLAAIEGLSLAGRKDAGQSRAFPDVPNEADRLPSVSCFTKARR